MRVESVVALKRIEIAVAWRRPLTIVATPVSLPVVRNQIDLAARRTVPWPGGRTAAGQRRAFAAGVTVDSAATKPGHRKQSRLPRRNSRGRGDRQSAIVPLRFAPGSPAARTT